MAGQPVRALPVPRSDCLTSRLICTCVLCYRLRMGYTTLLAGKVLIPHTATCCLSVHNPGKHACVHAFCMHREFAECRTYAHVSNNAKKAQARNMVEVLVELEAAHLHRVK